jgi:hypothetical protein
MKNLLFVLTLGAALACPALAQTTNNTPPPPSDGPPGGEHHDRMGFLTDAEKAELKAAHDAAVAKDPTLGTDEQTFHEQMKSAHESGTPPTEDQKAAWHAFRDKLDAAMVAADPNVAPIIAKMKAHHHEHGGPGGPGGDAGGTPPPPPAQ